MTDIQLLIGLSSTEGERKKRERMRLQQQNLLPQTVVDLCPPILELEKELDIELKIERELETGQTAHAPLGRYKNVVLSHAELAELKAELPTKWQHYIDRLYLQGGRELMKDELEKAFDRIAASAVPEQEDYTDSETGLLHCGICHTPKPCRVEIFGKKKLMPCTGKENRQDHLSSEGAFQHHQHGNHE